MSVLNLLQDDFIFRAFIASIGTSFLTGLLGIFVLWRRLGNLSDSITHSSLLGVVVAILINFDIHIGIMAIIPIFFILFSILHKYSSEITNTVILGIIFNFLLAISLILVSLFQIRADLLSLFIGDVLTVDSRDILIILALIILSSLFVFLNWEKLLISMISTEIADSDGIAWRYYYITINFLLMLSIIAILQVVGILMLSALFIMPSASARLLSKTPVQMAVVSICISIFSSVFGFLLAIYIDLPVSPAIIFIATICFIFSLITKSYRFR